MTAAQAPRGAPRIEYLGFQNIDECREYSYAVHSTDGACRFRFRIALAAFAKARLLIQDGPDVCYQQLMRHLAEGDVLLATEARSIHESELRAYHDAHAPAAKTRSAAAKARDLAVSGAAETKA